MLCAVLHELPHFILTAPWGGAIVIPFYTWGEWDSERSSDLSKVIQWRRLRIQLGIPTISITSKKDSSETLALKLFWGKQFTTPTPRPPLPPLPPERLWRHSKIAQNLWVNVLIYHLCFGKDGEGVGLRDVELLFSKPSHILQALLSSKMFIPVLQMEKERLRAQWDRAKVDLKRLVLDTSPPTVIS